jgi:NAD(P)-dependent dehydrogenase (short-subunit alcohol dehydrogenase family)
LTLARNRFKPGFMTQIALITGASRGLGFALAEALAPKYHIIAVGRTVGALEELDDRIKAKGGDATLAPMDICNRDAMAHLCRSIHDRWGGIALWAHTAIHTAALTPVPHLDQKGWEKSVATNVTAMGHLIPFVDPLLGDAGTALFFDDPKGGEQYYGYYGSTKAAQIALARSWQAENQKIGPKVHILQPNPMPTHSRARFYPGEDRSTLPSTMDEAQRLLADLNL